MRQRKREKSPNNEDGESDDDEYLPTKRARMSLTSTRAIRTVRDFSIHTITDRLNKHMIIQENSTSSVVTVTSDQAPPPQKAPVDLAAGRSCGSEAIPSSSQLTDKEDRAQPDVRQPTIRRRPARTASVASIPRRPSTIIREQV